MPEVQTSHARAKHFRVHAVNMRTLERLGSMIDEWSQLWGVPRLRKGAVIRSSSRFRTSLGSYHAARGEITLAAWLFEGPQELLREVLCHETAHAAVHFVHGNNVRPHGREWRDLMDQAHVPARVRIPAADLPESRRAAITSPPKWEHRCPVCQATRLAGKRVTRWRCRQCRDQGRSGELLIERVPGPVAVDR